MSRVYVTVEFMYRDGGNYKSYYERTFPCERAIGRDEAEEAIRSRLDGWGMFDREALGVDLDIELPYESGETAFDEMLDGTALEVDGVEVSEELPADAVSVDATFSEFLGALERAKDKSGFAA